MLLSKGWVSTSPSFSFLSKQYAKGQGLLWTCDEVASRAAWPLHQYLYQSLRKGITCLSSHQLLQLPLLPQASSRPVLLCAAHLLTQVPKAPACTWQQMPTIPLYPMAQRGVGFFAAGALSLGWSRTGLVFNAKASTGCWDCWSCSYLPQWLMWQTRHEELSHPCPANRYPLGSLWYCT